MLTSFIVELFSKHPSLVHDSDVGVLALYPQLMLKRARAILQIADSNKTIEALLLKLIVNNLQY